MTPALETVGLQKNFGGIIAANGVSLRLARGARHALIGPNGAGKTTVINLLAGVLAPSAGRILLEGEDITRLAPHRRVQRGLARTFQINQLFADLTPLEAIGLAESERMGRGADWWRAGASSLASAELVAVYTLAAGYAGAAGALLAQTTAFCSLDVLSFERSADLLLVLILGGAGYLYGGLIGAVAFKLMQDWLAAMTPQYWQFWIGLLLVAIVLAGWRRA